MSRLCVALSAALLVTSAARAEMDLDGRLSQDAATGDWGGLRSRVEAAGLTVEGTYQTDLLANPIGGEQQGFAYDGLMEISLDFDLDKIAGLKGTSFFIAGYWASGEDLSDTKIGNLNDVSALEHVRHQRRATAGSHAGLSAKHGLNDDRRRADVNHVDIQALFFVIARFLGDPPGEAGGADRSERKGNFSGRLRRKTGHTEEEKQGEKKG